MIPTLLFGANTYELCWSNRSTWLLLSMGASFDNSIVTLASLPVPSRAVGGRCAGSILNSPVNIL